MEDAVTETLIESATSVAFVEIESALEHDSTREKDGAPARALTATVVAVGPPDRLWEVVQPLQHLGNSGAIRGILIPMGSGQESGAQVGSNVVVLTGLQDNFIDNAVAALRLSSLPTVIWWRGGSADVLANLIKLADRVVLDADPPEPGWKVAIDRFDAAASFNRLCIEGSDRAAAALFGAWMKSELQWGDNVTIEIQESEGPSAITCISLTGGNLDLHLQLAKSQTCVESAARVGQAGTSRVVSLGDDSLTALLSEELRIRSRDHGFERALSGVMAS